MTPLSYNTWVATMTPICIKDSTLVLQVKDPSTKNTLKSIYTQTLTDCINRANSGTYLVRFIDEAELPLYNAYREDKPVAGSDYYLNPKYTFESFVGTNAPEAGHMQGQMVGEYLLENYDTVDLNGDGVISYVMFKGQEGNAEAEARTQFGVEDANAVLTAAGKPELAYYNASATDKYLVDQGGKWSAQAANDYMATILPEYSEANGNMVELIICNNDGMAEGAVSALQGAGYNTGDGKTIPVFGVDATDSAKQLINEGKMTGTIKQDAEGMASTILNLVSSVQGGGELMDNTSSFNVDEGVAKIRAPYATYTGE